MQTKILKDYFNSKSIKFFWLPRIFFALIFIPLYKYIHPPYEIGEFTELDDSAWDKVFSVNLDGLRKVSQEVTRQLIVAKRPGVIINVASVAGMNAAPGWTVYATSKAAVIHLTKNMAIELWRHNIRVNALCPGYFPTEMNEEFFASEQGQNYLKRLPPRRTGNLDELTGPLLLLASDASSYITGIALPVDGGHSIRLV